MAGKFPFPAKKAAPGKKPNPFAKFEKSGKDSEPKGMKEGSKKEEALDKKQMGKSFPFKK